MSSRLGRGLRLWKVPEHPARTGLGSSGQGAPRSWGSPELGPPSDRARLPHPRRGARGQAGGAGRAGAGRGERAGVPPLRSSAPLLRGRARQSGGKVRHKRQALQDMARPLKQWLYKHRDNPYPTKTEKILLALGSQMTLVQVRKGTLYPHFQMPL